VARVAVSPPAIPALGVTTVLGVVFPIANRGSIFPAGLDHSEREQKVLRKVRGRPREVRGCSCGRADNLWLHGHGWYAGVYDFAMGQEALGCAPIVVTFENHALPLQLGAKPVAGGFLIILVFAFAASIVGNVLGIMHGSDYSGWENVALTPGILDLPSFVRVAYIHNASYLGGLVGLVVAIIYLRKLRNTEPAVPTPGIQPSRLEPNQNPSVAGSRR